MAKNRKFLDHSNKIFVVRGHYEIDISISNDKLKDNEVSSWLILLQKKIVYSYFMLLAPPAPELMFAMERRNLCNE